jgi:hypothetical protein
MARAAWGAGNVTLRGGAGASVLQGGDHLLGVKGGGLVEEQRGFASGSLFFLNSRPKTTRGRGF